MAPRKQNGDEMNNEAKSILNAAADKYLAAYAVRCVADDAIASSPSEHNTREYVRAAEAETKAENELLDEMIAANTARGKDASGFEFIRENEQASARFRFFRELQKMAA